MHLLIVVRSDEYYRFVESIVDAVIRRGGRVTLITRDIEQLIKRFGDVLPAGVAIEAARPNRSRSGRWLQVTRELRSYLHWLTLRLQPEFLLNRWLNYIPRVLGTVLRLAGRLRLEPLLTDARLRGWLSRFEERSTPSRNILEQIQSIGPDIVLITPLLYAGAWEVDYLKACRQLGQAHAVLVASWDNLSSKGIFHVRPDLVLVWNDIQVREAILYHSQPESGIVAIGAPVFDWMFSGDLLRRREDFCRSAGVDPARPYIVYAVSSSVIHGDETAIVRNLSRCLEERAPGQVQILVRPHPKNRAGWDNFAASEIRVNPPQRSAGRRLEKDDLFNTLYHAAAVVALNTSVLLEAAILDRPALTLLFQHANPDSASKKHTEFPHFESLLQGEFLDQVEDERTCAERIIEIVRGDDTHREARSAFVQRFVRPNGLEIPAGRAAVDLLERLALMPSAQAAQAHVPEALGLSQTGLIA